MIKKHIDEYIFDHLIDNNILDKEYTFTSKKLGDVVISFSNDINDWEFINDNFLNTAHIYSSRHNGNEYFGNLEFDGFAVNVYVPSHKINIKCYLNINVDISYTFSYKYEDDCDCIYNIRITDDNSSYNNCAIELHVNEEPKYEKLVSIIDKELPDDILDKMYKDFQMSKVLEIGTEIRFTSR